MAISHVLIHIYILDSIEYLELTKMYGEWRYAKSKMIQPRISSKVVSISDNIIWVIGGYGLDHGVGNTLNTIEVFTFDSKSYKDSICTGPVLKVPRAAFSITKYDNYNGYRCIHIVGGMTGSDDITYIDALDSCEIICVDSKHMDKYTPNNPTQSW